MMNFLASDSVVEVVYVAISAIVLTGAGALFLALNQKLTRRRD